MDTLNRFRQSPGYEQFVQGMSTQMELVKKSGIMTPVESPKTQFFETI